MSTNDDDDNDDDDDGDDDNDDDNDDAYGYYYDCEWRFYTLMPWCSFCTGSRNFSRGNPQRFVSRLPSTGQSHHTTNSVSHVFSST